MSEETECFLQPLSDARNLLHSTENELAYLARAFEVTGNAAASKALMNLASDIQAAREMVDEGNNAAFNRMIADSHNASNNMLRAAFAMAELKSGGAVSSHERQGGE